MPIDVTKDQFITNIPDSLSWDYQVQSIGMTSDTQAAGLQTILPQLLVLCNIPNLPEPILDLLAFQFQVLFYNPTNNITDPDQRIAAKRSLLANNFYYHAHLGTPDTVSRIVSTVYPVGIIQEWFTYGGTANHFRMLLPSTIDTSLENSILSLINVTKRASQAFEGFFLYSAAPTGFYVAVGVFTQIWMFLPMPVSHPHVNYLVMGMSLFASATVHRSSAVVRIALGMSVSALGRRVAQGANVCDIRIKAAVNVHAKAMASAAAKIFIGTSITTPVTRI